MHELSVCQALLTQVADLARDHRANTVHKIVIRVGPLAGVEPRLLVQAFPLACAGTLAESAKLVIEELPLRVHCETCSAESVALPNRLVCGACGDWHTRLVSGDELLLASVELSREEDACVTPAAVM
jgi:hydrogenase nickel incorporation protein HypA/HybF